MMHIGDTARLSGVSVKSIRHYESVGLLRSVDRQANGYRTYDVCDVHELRFIRRARLLGFSIEAIRDLLGLWRNKQRRSRTVRKLAEAHLDQVTGRLQALQDMAGVLRHLIDACDGDDRPDCPILNELGATD
jgi:Cu(I)-responsive transcriptional regulator